MSSQGWGRHSNRGWGWWLVAMPVYELAACATNAFPQTDSSASQPQRQRLIFSSIISCMTKWSDCGRKVLAGRRFVRGEGGSNPYVDMVVCVCGVENVFLGICICRHDMALCWLVGKWPSSSVAQANLLCPNRRQPILREKADRLL